MPAIIGVLKETTAGETRVAIVPEVISKFTGLGAQLLIETICEAFNVINLAVRKATS